MAGEWIALDVGLPDKPEVQELIDLTGEPVEVVVYRLYRLWSWAAMNCSDGMARMTIPRLVRTCGADHGFWQAVAGVGWLEIDETAATVAVPGWDRRFSQAAKSRAQHQDRSKAYEHRNPGRRDRAGRSGARAPDYPAPERGRGDKRRLEVPPPPREAAHSGEAWQRLRDAWNAGACPAARRRPWKPAQAPDGAEEVILAAGWLDDALEAIPRLAACRFFDSPVTLIQFTSPGFVQKILGGQYDAPKTPKGGQDRRDGDRPPIRVDPEFEAMRAATLAREAARREAEHRRLDQAAADAESVGDLRRSVAHKLRTTAGG